MALIEHRECPDGRNVMVKCACCAAEVKAPKWYVNQGAKLYFCSSACRMAWEADSWLKETSVCLDGRPDYRGANWSIQSQKARARDKYVCQMCYVTEEHLGKQLDVHHVIPYRLFKSSLEANRLDNLISLCHACHMKVEAENNQRLPLFARAPSH